MNEADFRQTVQTYAPALTAYAYGICADLHAAQDIVQEVFLSYLDNTGKIGNAKPWLYKVCRNKTIDRHRKIKEQTASIEAFKNIKVEGELPSEKLQREELYEAMFKCVATLRGEEAEILNLKYFGKLSYAEIAAVLDISVSNVGVRLNRALAVLREKMEKFERGQNHE